MEAQVPLVVTLLVVKSKASCARQGLSLVIKRRLHFNLALSPRMHAREHGRRRVSTTKQQGTSLPLAVVVEEHCQCVPLRSS